MAADSDSTAASTSLASISISSAWALATVTRRSASLAALIVPPSGAWSLVVFAVIIVFSWEMKTPMAWATERVGRHHAIGADKGQTAKGRLGDILASPGSPGQHTETLKELYEQLWRMSGKCGPYDRRALVVGHKALP